MTARPLMTHIAAETADILLAAEVLNETQRRVTAHVLHSLAENRRACGELETADFAEAASRLLLAVQRVLDERTRSERRAYLAARRARHGVTVERDTRPAPDVPSAEAADALAEELLMHSLEDILN